MWVATKKSLIQKLFRMRMDHSKDKVVTPHFWAQLWPFPPLDFGPAPFIMRALWICGITPPPAMVALMRVSSSSSPLIASCKCLGVILLTLRSLEALPASSKTSAVKYSRIAALYTAEVAPTLLFAATLLFKILWILPTGNYTYKWLLKPLKTRKF